MFACRARRQIKAYKIPTRMRSEISTRNGTNWNVCVHRARTPVERCTESRARKRICHSFRVARDRRFYGVSYRIVSYKRQKLQVQVTSDSVFGQLLPHVERNAVVFIFARRPLSQSLCSSSDCVLAYCRCVSGYSCLHACISARFVPANENGITKDAFI